MAHKTDVVLEEHDRQDPWNPISLPKGRNIDYDLVRLLAAEASKAANATGASKNHHSIQVTDIGAPPVSRTPVIVVTSYNLLTGAILPGSKRTKMHGFYGFQDLLTARLSCPIKTGDSGSAVVDASTGRFYGHIVLGSAPDTLVYIVPLGQYLLLSRCNVRKSPGIKPRGPNPGCGGSRGELSPTQHI